MRTFTIVHRPTGLPWRTAAYAEWLRSRIAAALVAAAMVGCVGLKPEPIPADVDLAFCSNTQDVAACLAARE